MRRLSPMAVALALGACAAQGGDEGGAAHLPDRGIAGWSVVGTTEDPFVLTPGSDGAPDETFGGPSALVVDDAIVVWFHALTPAGPVIRRASSPDGEAFGPAEDVLAGRDPSVARTADGGFVMAYDADGAVALAASDDGRTFVPLAATGLPSGSEPAIVVDGAALVVFVVQDGVVTRWDAGPDRAFVRVADADFAPGAGCVDAFGEAEPCWDEGALGGPDVRLATTATGRRVWRMMYAARRGATADLGFAASFDGRTWSRYAFNPVVEEAFSQEAPSAVVRDDGYRLYWYEPRSSTFGGIVLARSPATAPTERW